MAAQDDLATISKGYEAFGAGDIQTVMDLFADGIAWHIPGKNALAGDYQGKDQVMQFFGKLQELTGGTFSLTIHDLLASDDHVVALCREQGSRNGKTLDENTVHVWHLRDGKPVEFWGITGDPYSSDDFYS
jgi:ketosteroid isomerase-like protein